MLLPLSFHSTARIPGLTDSKKLTPKQRDDLFVQIQKTAVAIGIGCAGNEEIDRVNILQATMLAMRQAIERICPLPDFVLVDGTQLPPISIRAEAIPKGDALYQSIAAASVIAKVKRDRFMIELDKVYPHYGFQGHKGYGTRQHRQAISKFGVCPIHRRSFKLQ